MGRSHFQHRPPRGGLHGKAAALQGKRQVCDRPQGEGEQGALVVVARHAVEVEDPAGAAAVDDVPLVAAIDEDRDRLHASAAERGAVARRVVEVDAPEAVRAMIAVARAGGGEGKLRAAVAAAQPVGGADGSAIVIGFAGGVSSRVGPARTVLRHGKTSVQAVVFPGGGRAPRSGRGREEMAGRTGPVSGCGSAAAGQARDVGRRVPTGCGGPAGRYAGTPPVVARESG